MRELLVRSLLLTSLLTLTALVPGAVFPARGANCGDGVGPCSCGDTVVTNTGLGGSDPVLKTPCPCFGLFVAPGVTLKINGTIRAAPGNVCNGITTDLGATDIVVTSGRLEGFAFGVAIFSSETRVSGLQVNDSPTCIFLQGGENNVVEGNITTGCDENGIWVDSGRQTRVLQNRTQGGSGNGILVQGDANVVSGNLAQQNVLGIQVGGDDNRVDANRARLNGQEGFIINGADNRLSHNLAEGNLVGFLVAGSGAIAEQNRSVDNGLGGFDITGTDHRFTLNHAVRNGTAGFADGFQVSADNSTFTRNRSDYNGLPNRGWGILDVSNGGNTYTDNRCTGNGFGDSNPAGLCF